MMRVTLNSLDYIVKEPLGWTYVDQISDVLRTQGIPVREDNPVISRLPYGWEKGIGWERQDRRNGSGVNGLRDSTCETRWPIAEIALNNETNIHNNASDHVKVYKNFSGNFFCLFEGEYQSARKNIVGVGKWSPDTWSAVAGPQFNDVSTGSGASGATTITVAHTVQSDAGARLVVAVVGARDSSTDSPTGVTYNSVAMTEVSVNSNAGQATTSIWYLVNPSTSSEVDCVATWAATQDKQTMAVSDYYYVNQTTPVRTAVANSGSSTTSSTVVTTVAGDLVVDGVTRQVSESAAPDSGQTERFDIAITNIATAGGEERATGTSTTLGWTWSSSGNFAALAVPLRAIGLVSWTDTAGNGVRGFDMQTHKGNLIVLASEGQGEELDYQWWSSVDGDVFTLGAGTGWPDTDFLTTTITRRNNFDDDEAKILDFGNTLMMALHDNRAAGTGQSIRIFYSTDDGANWTAGAVIPSGSGPKAWLRWKDVFSSPAVDSPTLITAEGVYRVDVGGTTFDQIIELDGDSNNGRWSVVGRDGDIYIGLGSGFIRVLHATNDGGWTTRQAGPPGDNFISTRQGHVNFMLAPDWPWLVVAYGGHAGSQTASVFYIEYEPQTDPRTNTLFQAWHHAYLESDANIDIIAIGYSAAPDATTRLFIALENATSSEMYHFERPDVSPAATGIAVVHQTSGILEFADDPMGDPNLTATVLQAIVDADGLSLASTGTSNEFIDYFNGLDGGNWNANDIGNFYSDDLDLVLASGVGVAARRLRNRLILNRTAATAANSPGLRDFEIQAFKRQAVLRQLPLEIDIEQTRIQTGVPSETQIANIEAIMDSGVQVPLLLGALSSFNVRVRVSPRFSLIAKDKGDGVGLGVLTGTMTVVVEEAL